MSTSRARPLTILPIAAVNAGMPPGRVTSDAMPTGGPLVDAYRRIHDSLRISVTDRCNYRCVYCMPHGGLPWLPRSEILSFEEVVRICRVARSLGVNSVRLTGGEPLMRSGIPELVCQLHALGLDELSLTTNGYLLPPVADALAAAGLDRANISCDSLSPERFARIRRRGSLHDALSGMDAAEAAGLTPVKVNVVLLAGVNDDEVLDFAAFARRTGRVVRFIEFMPLDSDGTWRRDRVVPGDVVLDRIHAMWPLERVVTGQDANHKPAERYRFADGQGEIGVISSVTRPFCGACNRLRVTADGAIRNCLFSDDEPSVRDVLRSGGSDDDIATLLRKAVWGKRPGHGINDPGFLRPVRSMSMIGG